MSKKNKPNSVQKDKAQPSTSQVKVIKDYIEFGRITTEDLNDFFDNDVMSSMTASAKRRLDRR